jgi:hypothetical protein
MKHFHLEFISLESIFHCKKVNLAFMENRWILLLNKKGGFPLRKKELSPHDFSIVKAIALLYLYLFESK